jgi:peptide subunit release factor 1 (eRF1)
MEPKLKAKELVEKFKNDLFKQRGVTIYTEDAILCALIAVDLLIECTPSMDIYPPNFQTKHPRVKEYWKEVKQEIEKL